MSGGRKAALQAIGELSHVRRSAYASLLARTVLEAHGGPLTTGQVLQIVQTAFPNATYNQIAGGLRTLCTHGLARRTGYYTRPVGWYWGTHV